MSKPDNNPRILLVEDDANLCFFLQKFLENKGYYIKAFQEGDAALNKAQKDKFDLYLIDIGLPKVNGFTIVNKIREVNNTAPIIIITDKDTIINEIESFNIGANLFHRKPLNYELLLIQIKNLLRDFSFRQVIEIGDLYIDIPRKLVKKEGKDIHLTFNEFNLLLLLVKDQCKVFTRDQILTRVLNGYKDIDNGAVDTLISRLRKKLGTYKGHNVIETIYKSGFRLSLQYFNALPASSESYQPSLFQSGEAQ